MKFDNTTLLLRFNIYPNKEEATKEAKNFVEQAEKDSTKRLESALKEKNLM